MAKDPDGRSQTHPDEDLSSSERAFVCGCLFRCTVSRLEVPKQFPISADSNARVIEITLYRTGLKAQSTA